jgi:hypothetical protein
MSLISFPFDIFSPKNIYTFDATPSVYVPPGFLNGLRSTLAYTVPASTKSLVSFSLSASGFAQAGTGIVSFLINRSQNLTFAGVAGDLFVGFSECYYNSGNIVYNFIILKNGVTVFSQTQTVSNSNNKTVLANLFVQANEFNP